MNRRLQIQKRTDENFTNPKIDLCSCIKTLRGEFENPEMTDKPAYNLCLVHNSFLMINGRLPYQVIYHDGDPNQT